MSRLESGQMKLRNPEFPKLQQFINSLQKLQPEMEICSP